MNSAPLTSDLCIKCNICTSACPVAAVTDLLPGPKAAGPQAQRFRDPHLPSPDRSLDYCSACGACSLVCPHGVQIAEMNAIVTVAEQNCCGLPMQSNGDFESARAYARSNIRKLAPWVREGYIVVGTSTSCTLAIKHEYHAVLGLDDPDLIANENPSRVVCDSETCRWWIESHTGKKVVHPIEVMAEAYKGRR